MNKLLPNEASNKYKFNKIIYYTFIFITLVTIIRSLIHLFVPDGGANSIATIIQFTGNPDPDKVIYFVFSLWGLSQLLMGLIYIIVIIKYKNLIPLMYLLLTIEYSMRLFIGQALKPYLVITSLGLLQVK